MRVAIVSPVLERCGIAVHTEVLVKHLSEFADVYVVRHHRFGEISNNYLSWLVRRVDRVVPDIVHVQHEYGIFRPFDMFITFLGMLRYPIVTTMHTVGIPSVDGKLVFVKNLRRVVVQNEAMRDVLIKSFKRVEVIPMFVPDVPSISKEEARSELGIPEDAFVVSTIGFIDERKGTDIFLEVVSMLGDVYPIIVGGWHTDVYHPFAKSVLERANKLGVRVTGWVSDHDFYAYISASDVIVLPIRAITESCTIHCALAYKKPVVVADAEPLKDKPVIRCRSVDEMVEAVERVRKGYVPKGIDEYVSSRTSDKIAKMYYDLYERVLSED